VQLASHWKMGWLITTSSNSNANANYSVQKEVQRPVRHAFIGIAKILAPRWRDTRGRSLHRLRQIRPFTLERRGGGTPNVSIRGRENKEKKGDRQKAPRSARALRPWPARGAIIQFQNKRQANTYFGQSERLPKLGTRFGKAVKAEAALSSKLATDP